ncbi:DNA alkylation repair protein [Nodosilinea sp. FACHB-131]|uniref:DNA alkylation repair protein n=1 Tax=Leptolyngbya subtilissima TaxID=1346803 RepID=UPI0016866481|nr:DNA alkylation repair protein [Nodosilinea sp. FACHB-131]
MLSQLGYQLQTDEALLLSLIKHSQDSKELFTQNAVGWMLREYSKTASEAVQVFVVETLLVPSISKKL